MHWAWDGALGMGQEAWAVGFWFWGLVDGL